MDYDLSIFISHNLYNNFDSDDYEELQITGSMTLSDILQHPGFIEAELVIIDSKTFSHNNRSVDRMKVTEFIDIARVIDDTKKFYIINPPICEFNMDEFVKDIEDIIYDDKISIKGVIKYRILDEKDPVLEYKLQKLSDQLHKTP